MVKALHRAGIEVILDVVYNHTAEGNHLGPMLSFKGVDNASYYRLMPDDPRHYIDFTGTGNSLNPVHPSVLRLIMDSLRYWVDRVPRRRLPLRPRRGARARVLRRRPAVGVLRRDPPGPGALAGEADRRAVGRRPGRLPGRQLPGAVVGVERRLPRHDARLLARSVATAASSPSACRARPTCTRPTGAIRSRRSTSSPPTTASRCATSSPTSDKHNEANLEDNHDGTDDNRSWNCGVEGETDDPEILELRARQQRNFLTTLFALPGHADAARRRRDRPHPARQQQRLVPGQRDLLVRLEPSTAQRTELRDVHAAADPPAPRAPRVPPRQLPARRRRWSDSGLPDVWWFRPDGRKMTRRDWQRRRARARDVPQRTRRSRRLGHRGEDDRGRLVPGAVQRRTTRTACSCSRAGGSARSGRSSSRPPSRAPPAGSVSYGARTEVEVDRALDRDPEAGGVTATGERAARDLPPPADRRLRLRRRARARPLPARPRHLPPLPVAVAAGPPRARPTATTSSTRAGSRTSSAASTSSGGSRLRPRDAGMGVILDVVPNHMAADDANRYWADPRCARGSSTSIRRPAATGASSTSTTSPASARRIPEVFEETHALVLALVRDGLIDGAARRSPRRARRSRRLPGAAARARRRARLGREDPRPRRARCATGRCAGPSATSSSNDVCALFVDPAGEAALTALWESVSGDRRTFGEVALEAKLEQARGTFRPEVERLARELDADDGDSARAVRTRSHRALARARVAAGLPDLRRAGGAAASTDADRARARRTWMPPRSAPAAARRPRPRSSSRAFSRPRRRSWPRASRTPRSTATAGCWR